MRLRRLRMSTTRFALVKTMFFQFMCSIHGFHRYIMASRYMRIYIRSNNACRHRYISTCDYCCFTSTTNTTLIYTGYRFTSIISTIPLNFAISCLILYACINYITSCTNCCGTSCISLCNGTAFINDVFLSIYRDCIVPHNRTLCITNFVIRCNRSSVPFNKTIVIVNSITSKSHIFIRHNTTTIFHSINRKVNGLSLQICCTFYSFCIWG